ncbi:Putative peptidoglycan binding domain-containing protein [Cnuella takakiae]|uniref:Putative peptidoglycan binding domain-containing protein n=1 Tax=Cnuella takakiae TaxID=1302690 RepID=A0A1M5CHB8_9BACT|nr:peptidoglycan-binding domain-containing protein [Cnuella takakiae]SHF53792.1 Putative peptidoglycan binding domain-containing protein [Cnuella takakiae]
MENANWKGPWDCAEFVTYCVNRITGKLYGYRGMEGGGAYTGYWYEDARNGIVKSVSLADALKIEGAILLRKPKVVNERKLIGHIAFTDGKGKTVEARGAQYGVMEYEVGRANERKWDIGILVPEISCVAGAEGIRKLNLHGSPTFDRSIQNSFSVASLQKLKIRLSELNLYQADDESSNAERLELALYNFQVAKGLEPSGILDRDTEKALFAD